ncbi:MAG: hypothetical protein IBX40_09600 [Methanosarcinales archaeon]|nr:hypothetical protein [Methanosarcinales archaeon]
MEYTSRIMYAGLFVCKLTPIISGCIDKKDLGGIDENFTQILTSVKPDSEVPPAPQQLFINHYSSETFQFRGHNIMISDLAISPHLVEVTVDGDTETIEINRSTKCPGNHCGYYATKDDIDYSIKPVVRTYNETGERIWSFETWNSQELYFEAN